MQTYLVSVNRLYENLEYERALEQIASAKRLTRGVEDDVLLALYEGVILADMGKWSDATAAFQSALFLRPDAKLPVKVAPKVEKRFEEVRQQVKKELGPASLAKRQAERQQAEEKARQETSRARVALPPEALPRAGEVPERADLRSRALIPAIAGGVLLAAGGVSYGLARGELSRLEGDDSSLATSADVQASVSRGKTYQGVGFALMGAGVVGLGVATGLFVLGAPKAPVALGVGTDGTSAFVFGRWP